MVAVGRDVLSAVGWGWRRVMAAGAKGTFWSHGDWVRADGMGSVNQGRSGAPGQGALRQARR